MWGRVWSGRDETRPVIIIKTEISSWELFKPSENPSPNEKTGDWWPHGPADLLTLLSAQACGLNKAMVVIWAQLLNEIVSLLGRDQTWIEEKLNLLKTERRDQIELIADSSIHTWFWSQLNTNQPGGWSMKTLKCKNCVYFAAIKARCMRINKCLNWCHPRGIVFVGKCN